MIRALVARGFTVLTSAVFGILTARLLLANAPVEYFTLYSLITTLPSLLSFQDLGTGAAIVNAIASSPHPATDDRVVTTITSVGRIMLTFASVLMAVNVGLLATGTWQLLLGDAGALPNAGLAAFIGLSLYCVGVPFGIWQRVLLGLQSNHLTVLIQGMLAPINFVIVWVLVNQGASAWSFAAAATYIAMFVVSIVGVTVATRLLPGAVTLAVSRLLSFRGNPGVRVMDVGWPMLAQILSSPLAVGSQRYVLAQVTSAQVVAEYTAGAQVFLALTGVVSAAGVALWPMFTRKRTEGELTSGPYLLSAQFAGAALAIALGVWVFRDPLFGFTTAGKLDIASSTVLAFGAMLVLQAALYPLGMFIMDKPGLRFQVTPTLIMAFGSLALSFPLAAKLGVVGPIVSNVLFVLFAQLLPFSVYIWRNRDRLWGG